MKPMAPPRPLDEPTPLSPPELVCSPSTLGETIWYCCPLMDIVWTPDEDGDPPAAAPELPAPMGLDPGSSSAALVLTSTTFGSLFMLSSVPFKSFKILQ